MPRQQRILIQRPFGIGPYVPRKVTVPGAEFEQALLFSYPRLQVTADRLQTAARRGGRMENESRDRTASCQLTGLYT